MNSDAGRNPSQEQEPPSTAAVIAGLLVTIWGSLCVSSVVMSIVELLVWLHGLVAHWINGHLQATRGLGGEILWGGLLLLTLAVFGVLTLGSTALVAGLTATIARRIARSCLRSPIAIWAAGVTVTVVVAAGCLVMLQALGLEMPCGVGDDGELEQARFLVRLDAVLADPALLVPSRLISSLAPLVFVIVSLYKFREPTPSSESRTAEPEPDAVAPSGNAARHPPQRRPAPSSPPPIAW